MTAHRPATDRPLRPSEIATALRTRITSGELVPGGKLPSTRLLAEELGATERAVYEAVALLKMSGHVTSHQGKGVFVRLISPLEFHAHRFERGDRRDDGVTDDWRAGVEEQGRVATQDDPEVSAESAAPDIAAWLRVSPGTQVLARRRIRRVDGEPFQLADSYFPIGIADDCPELWAPHDIARPGGILAHNGHPQTRLRDELRPWLPTPEESERLGLPTNFGGPAIQHVRIGYGGEGDGGMPIRVMVTIAPGHLNTVVYEMEV
ncbi:GntR family transcriptional regulator [Streptomyces lavendulae]|uniref:GntR family transcriptional regulator n=1 Tax=Streptomyces lavendulae TaxID=1914 RepID=UPI002553E279|nr:GntR family transcriptional regulator [Streptomyces lavendulae]